MENTRVPQRQDVNKLGKKKILQDGLALQPRLRKESLKQILSD